MRARGGPPSGLRYAAEPWPTSTSSPCTACGGRILPTRWCWTTSRCRSSPAPRSACSGANGAGKSTLLRIMAGLDREFSGDAILAPGATVGLLPQEPDLDPSKDVRGNVEEGVAEHGGPAGAASRRSARRLGEVGARRDGGAARRVPGGAGRDRAAERLGRRAHARRRHGRPARAARRPGRDDPVGRRAPPRRALPAAAVGARPAAARRAHQPPRRRVGGVARAVPGGVPGHRRRRDPRPLLPRQRRRLDPGARPRQGHPVAGQLLVLARAEAHAAGAGGEVRVGPPEGAGARARVGAQQSPRARQAKSKARLANYERLVAEEGARRSGTVEIRIPAAAAAGRPGARGRGPHQGLRRPAADGRTSRSRCRPAASWASSAPTAPARRRCSG